MSRHPLYAAIYNNSLVYGTTGIFGQAMFPWRPLTSSTATGTTVSPGTSLTSPSPMVTPLAQLPGLVYPLPTLGMQLVAPGGGSPQSASSSEGKTAVHQGYELVKRRNEDVSHPDVETKRPRRSESTPQSPLTPDSHASMSSARVIPPSSHFPSSQRSPVIKFIPYKPGQTVLLPQAVASSSSSLPQAVLVPIPTTSPLQTPSLEKRTTSAQHPRPVPVTPYTPNLLPAALPADLRIVLLKCFGPVSESVISGNQLLVSNILQDLYRPSYFTTSNYSDPPLSPESCALLTISYLNTLKSGEGISMERLRTMMHYAQLGEIEWLHYYKKHKKMSESTFVQSQLMHLSRVSVYPGLGKVRVMISSQNLGDGVSLALHNLAQLVSVSRECLPEFVVVLAIRPSSTVDFCVLAVGSLQVRLLAEAQLSVSPSTGSKRASKWRESSGIGRQQTQHLNGLKVSISIDEDLLLHVRTVHKRLSGHVLVPFQCPSLSCPDSISNLMTRSPLVLPEVAEGLVPPAPRVVEHLPAGPYQLQYNMALHLLQRLIAVWGSERKIEGYDSVDFCVLCPSEESFVQQTIHQITESRIMDHLGLGVGEEVTRRVIRCGSSDMLSDFMDRLDNNTLYIVVAESSHLTTSITCHRPRDKAVLSDSEELLCHRDNVLMLYVSSQPYALQTNRSLVSFTNEIHWPLPQYGTNKEEESVFCSPGQYWTTEWGHRISFREDTTFETAFQSSCKHLSSTQLSLASLRTELLLNEYTAALSSCSSSRPWASTHSRPSAETQQVVNCLIGESLSSPQGYGPMVIVRSHDTALGRQFYRKLRAVRDSLGLKFCFEVILDDGTQPIAISKHFQLRLGQWQCRGSQAGHVTSYRDLEHLPCVVVLVGQLRAGLSFPNSLRCVDLRMCYSSTITRAVYEYDISFFNGYRGHLLRRTSSDNDQEVAERERMTENGESESEVFDNACVEAARRQDRVDNPVRVASSSSSRKSSCVEVSQEGPEEANKSGTVVEWRPHSSLESDSGDRGDVETEDERSESGGEEGGEEGGAMDVGESQEREYVERMYERTGPVTVSIDPPEDQVGVEPPLPTSSSEVPTIAFQSPSLEQEEEEEEDLWVGLGPEPEYESEGDDEELPTPACVCLLSRPYYHIWSSRSPQRHLLLPPCPGVEWHGGFKRPPLFDPDPRQQSAHYRKWTKPKSREVKAELDSLIKEASRSSWRRFLLTGPSQVGKTGVWLLFIRLLHEHLRSAHGVVVMNVPQPSSLFLEDAGLKESSRQQESQEQEVGCRRGRIISLEQLHLIHQSLVGDKEMKLNALLGNSSPQTVGEASGTTISSPQTLSLSVSSHVTYDCTHSCADCSKYLRGSLSPSALLTSSLPMEEGASITIRWCVPSRFQQLFVISQDRKTVSHLKLPVVHRGRPSPLPLSPIFVPSLGRDSTGLFNLYHTTQESCEQMHVIVTSSSQFDTYRKAWPNHIIMALPDEGSLGLGRVYHTIKQFVQYNYHLNLPMESGRQTVWPLVLLMSDTCVMWKSTMDDRESSSDISLSEVLHSLESDPNCLQLAAISVAQWNQQWEERRQESCLSDYDLNHHFVLLNLSKTATVQYKSFNYNSSAMDFNLQLQASGLSTKLRTDIAVVRKYLPSGGNAYPVHLQLSGICSDGDHLITSLHHDSSSLLPYPGPYLMEHFLLLKSQSFFPASRHPQHPVLVVDNYLDLGPDINVTFVRSDSLCSKKHSDEKPGVKFGGLLLYLCEGKLNSDELAEIDFAPGACLCMVTQDCKSLVREVARLDLEEHWKFRLRDEYQTACPDNFQPLFFLMGRYEGH